MYVGSIVILLLLLLLLLLHPFNSLFSRTTWVSLYQKGKTSLDLNEARYDGVLGCSGISWTIRKQSAPRSRQTTTPTPHHSIFLQAGWSSSRPTNSVKALKALICRQQKTIDIHSYIVVFQRHVYPRTRGPKRTLAAFAPGAAPE